MQIDETEQDFADHLFAILSEVLIEATMPGFDNSNNSVILSSTSLSYSDDCWSRIANSSGQRRSMIAPKGAFVRSDSRDGYSMPRRRSFSRRRRRRGSSGCGMSTLRTDRRSDSVIRWQRYGKRSSMTCLVRSTSVAVYCWIFLLIRVSVQVANGRRRSIGCSWERRNCCRTHVLYISPLAVVHQWNRISLKRRDLYIAVSLTFAPRLEVKVFFKKSKNKKKLYAISVYIYFS